jgi:hypothetical protein
MREVAVEWLVPLSVYVDTETATVTRVRLTVDGATSLRPDEIFVPDDLLEAGATEEEVARRAEETAYRERDRGAWPRIEIVGRP